MSFNQKMYQHSGEDYRDLLEHLLYLDQFENQMQQFHCNSTCFYFIISQQVNFLISNFKFYLLVFWLYWVFIAVIVVSLVYSSSQYLDFSLHWLPQLQCAGSGMCSFISCSMCASVMSAHRLSCSAACGIFLAQGSNSCPLDWQVDSYPLRHQESPILV